MKITCSKNDLLAGINIVMKAVSSKTTLPILECIMLEAIDTKIKLITNDTELGIETYVEGSVMTPGRIAIDAKLFSDIIRNLPNTMISIDTDENNQVHIRFDKSGEEAKFDIAGKSGEDFVMLPELENTKMITISQFSLKEIIRQTIFSISDNENNKLMSGELFEVTGNHLKVVSLDGHRISIRNLELKDSYDSMKVIVPGKTLMEISKILTGGIEDDVNIYFSQNHILFEFDDTKVVSRLLEGEYYKIDQMLTTDYATKIIIDRQEFLDSINRANILIRESEKKPIILNINNSILSIKINSMIGQMDENIEVTKEGKDLMIGFNPKFLMDVLRVIDNENISIYMINDTSPCIIRDNEGAYTYLILPVNIHAVNR